MAIPKLSDGTPNSEQWALLKLVDLVPTAYGFRFLKCKDCNSRLMISYLTPDITTQYGNGMELCRCFCPQCMIDRRGLRPTKESPISVFDKTN